jgi:hypothetical protein
MVSLCLTAMKEFRPYDLTIIIFMSSYTIESYIYTCFYIMSNR